MKKKTNKWLFVIFCFIFLVLFSLKAFFDSGWGKSSNKIQAKLVSEKRICGTDEVVNLYVIFRNTGKETHTLVNRAFYATLNHYHNNKAYADAIGSYPEGNELITLKAGEKSSKYLIGHHSSRLNGPGVYMIKGGLNYRDHKTSEMFGANLEPIRIIVLK